MAGIKVIILVLATSMLCLPTTYAAFTGNPCLLGARAISGVISTSAGVALMPLQTETGAYNLRWAVRALWAGAVICFLVLLYLTIQRNRELYLFITLILAGHFVALFAQTTTSAIEGIVTFGPLALPTCAGLVYLPFRTQILNASSPDTEMNPIPSEDRQVTDDEVVVAEPAVLHPPEPPGRENGSDDIVNMLVTGVMGSVVQ